MWPRWWNLYRLVRVLGAPLYFASQLSPKRRSLLRRKLNPPKVPASKTIWVHTLSVGEVGAALPLLKALKKTFPEHFLIFTVATSSGYALASKRASGLADLIWPGPLDLPGLPAKYASRFHPEAFILVESDLWPGLLWELKGKGVPLLWANAALSSKAFKRLGRLRPLAELLLSPFDFIGAATRGDAERLSGLLAREVPFFSNLKFEIEPPSPEEVKKLSQELGPLLKRPLLVCGSTHPGEEEIILEAFRGGSAGLIICPRDPSRAPEILKLAQKRGFKASLRSKPSACEVLVVDTLGELKSLYGLGDAAFVGGTLVPVGGHNLLEPLYHGVPVLFGPYLESVADVAEIVLKEGLGFEVEDASALSRKWQKALQHKGEVKQKAPRVWHLFGSVSTKYAKTLKKMLKNQHL